MCRSIKILRTPYTGSVTDEDMRAAARQYFQIVSGYRLPPAATADAFHQAVETLTSVTRDLLTVVEASTAEVRKDAVDQRAASQSTASQSTVNPSTVNPSTVPSGSFRQGTFS